METTQHVLSTPRVTEEICECGKVCKNLRELRVHLAKTACGRVTSRKQRPGSPPGESQENTSQEEHHSTGNLQEDETLHDYEQALEAEEANLSDSFDESEEEAQETIRESVASERSETKEETRPKVNGRRHRTPQHGNT